MSIFLQYIGKTPIMFGGESKIKTYKKGDKVEFTDEQARARLEKQPELWKEIKAKNKPTEEGKYDA